MRRYVNRIGIVSIFIVEYIHYGSARVTGAAFSQDKFFQRSILVFKLVVLTLLVLRGMKISSWWLEVKEVCCQDLKDCTALDSKRNSGFQL